jgi:hypothetical protein
MSARTDPAGNMLLEASNVYLKAKKYINEGMAVLGEGHTFIRPHLLSFLESIDNHIRRIREYPFEFTPRRDRLTKEGILIDLENMKARINDLLATNGGRRKKSRKTTKSRRSRRTRKSRRYR